MKITAIVEKGSDGFYSVYSDNCIGNHCLGGYGSSAEEAKNDFIISIEEAKEMIKEEGGVIPANIIVNFKYDLQSFFNFFDWINVSQFAKKAGINESKMRQYKNGLAFANEATTLKILETIRAVASDLASASL